MSVDKSKNKQLLLTIPFELLNEIEAYWHKNKLQNRNEAIRNLVLKGLSK